MSDLFYPVNSEYVLSQCFNNIHTENTALICTDDLITFVKAETTQVIFSPQSETTHKVYHSSTP